MSEFYHKIKNVFKRDPDKKSRVIIDDWTIPEFEYLRSCEWVFTEKVDGTNIKIEFMDDKTVAFGGKTERANLHAHLRNVLFQHSDRWGDDIRDNMAGLTLFGEGYGPKIQKGGGLYRDTVDFVLFDVKAGRWWLRREDVQDIGEKLGLDVVPVVGINTLDWAIEAAINGGWKSAWGDFDSEGVVGRPKYELKTRSGERIICKIKPNDYRELS